MQLAPGDKLDHFEILSILGAGGMGEVYKARDTRLNRIVAIKVSKSEFSERFEREAKAVATLNHPHIAQLYDVGPNYLVMEFVEGAPLKGPLPLDKVLEYSGQMTDALDHAHTRGITHRDLKPANILLSKSGVKLLDFGLAKMSLASTDAEATATMALTQLGSVMGTIAYMAPEQSEGKEADARSDLYTFGLVLYEIVTGKRSYPRVDRQTLEPTSLQKVFRRCVEIDPENRWQASRDVKHALDLVQADTSAAPPSPRPIAWMGGAALATVAAIALGYLYLRTPPPQAAVVSKLSVLAPEGITLDSESIPLISPDGTKVAFFGRDSAGTNRLFVRPLDSLEARPLPGTESARNAFWSADSRSLAFQTVQYEMRRVDASGGNPGRMCTVALASVGGSWSTSGNILVGSNGNFPMMDATPTGGACKPVTVLNKERLERGHQFPFFLPDGRHFLYLALSAKREFTGIVVGSLDSKDTKFLIATSSPAVFASGHILFLRDQTLLAQPFDLQKLELSGEATSIADNVSISPYGDAMFSASSNGALVYRMGSISTSQLTWADRAGKILGPIGPPGDYVNPELSRDGKQVAFQRRNPQGDRDIWQLSVDRPAPQRFTFSAFDETLPVWSPDKSMLAFASNQQGASSLYQKPANGGGMEELLFRSDNAAPFDWSSDGRFIGFRFAGADGLNQGWFLPVSGDRKAFAYLQSDKFHRNQPRLSPNGRWIAYYSADSTQNEIYLEPFPKLGGRWQVSTSGGVSHRWSRDGKELFYMAPNGDLMAATIGGDVTPEIGTPQRLFRMRVLGGPRTLQGYRSQYDVAPDGRFLINTPVDGEAGGSMTVVLNWLSALRAPTAP